MKSFLVTGAHHRAVCALYEKQLEQQRGDWKGDIAALDASLEKSEARVQELHLKVLEMMTAKETAEATPIDRVPRRRKPEGPPENFDPGDPKQLFQQAKAETGSNNASRIFHRMQHIRDRMRPAGDKVQRVGAPTQADVNQMIQDAEFEGMTMGPIDRQEAS